MTYDKYAHLFQKEELEDKIGDLLKAKKELDLARGNVKKKKQKEVEEAYKGLIKASQPHLIYHELHLLDKSAADEFRNEWALSEESKELRGISSKAVWKAVEKPQIDLDILPP